MSSLNIGLSALSVAQKQLELVGQNIANANTPGYHRREAALAAIPGGPSGAGLGVEITSIHRAIDPLIENALVANASQASAVSTALGYLNQVQGYLQPGAGSLSDLVSRFFTQAQTLSSNPSDPTQRTVTINAAKAMSDGFNATVASFNQLRSGVQTQGQTSVDKINALASQIAQLNSQIANQAVNGNDASDIQDNRDSLISQLASQIDIRVLPQQLGMVNVLAGGASLVLGAQSYSMQLSSQGGQLSLTQGSLNTSVTPQGGAIAGILGFLNQTLPGIRSQFDAFSQQLVGSLDEIHGKGVGLNGPMTFLSSQRSVADPSQPLGGQTLAYPPQKGVLAVTVTNLSTGSRRQSQIAFDPATQSLNDLAASISKIPNIQAVVDPQSGQLKILSKPGYGFDFTGNLSSTPDAQSWSGTSAIGIAGSYAGSSNDTYTFHVVGSGTVGVTPNLQLQVTNSANAVVGTIPIGQGYSPGTALPAIDGVRATLGSGTVSDGDTFSIKVTADSDTARLISALGLNSFFTGDPTQGLQVRADLLASPQNFAASVTGQPGDGTNLANIIALADKNVMGNGTQTFQQYLTSIVTQVGSQVQAATQHSQTLTTIGQGLSEQQQSVSGVDPNIQLANMLLFQRNFQMSSKYITAVDQTMNELFNLIH